MSNMWDLNTDMNTDDEARGAEENAEQLIGEGNRRGRMDDSGTSTSSMIVNANGGEQGEEDSSDGREHAAHTFTFDIMNNGMNQEDAVNIGSSSSAGGSRMMLYTSPSFGGGSRSSSSATSPKSSWLNLSFPESAEQPEMRILQAQQQQPQMPVVKKSRRGPRSRSSQYRGVTFYRRTGRWESHIWFDSKP